ncbi:MAG: PD-(D/E)XK nuclease family protein [Polyangiales bacterium]
MKPPRPWGEALDALANDPALAALDALGVPFDPLAVLGVSRQERPHTRLLAWMLDPAPGPNAHPFGATPLEVFATACLAAFDPLPGATLTRAPTLGPIDASTVTVTREAAYGNSLRGNARAPDLVVRWRETDGAPWVLVIEDKLDADEGDAQTADYLRWAREAHPEANRALVFLTPDGRPPRVTPDTDVVCRARWGDVADLLLRALGELPVDTPASRFALTALESLRARFSADARAGVYVVGLYARHPAAVARASNPAPDGDVVALAERFPSAVWHLRAARDGGLTRPPRARWTRTFSEAVAVCVETLDPDAVPLTPAAPSMTSPRLASWTLGPLTERLALQLFATDGRDVNLPSARLWVGLFSPNRDLASTLAAREQSHLLEHFPPAVPVTDASGQWRWLRVGEAVRLPPDHAALAFFDLTAQRALSLLQPLAPLLDRVRDDPSQRLYSCDLDPELQLPTDTRDREDLCAAPHTQFVRVATRQPTGHPAELHAPHALGLALVSAFGGRDLVAYDYAPAPAVTPSPPEAPPNVIALSRDVFALGLPLLRGARDASLDALATEVHRALARRDAILLLGDAFDLDLAREVLPELFAPIVSVASPITPDELSADPDDPAAALVDRGPFAPAMRVTLSPAATVPVTFSARGARWPLVARWKLRASPVTLWLGGAFPPSLPPERFARAWRALTGLPL